MRSIRLSLILCILLLLVLSLAAVSGLVYRTTEQYLAKKNTELRELWRIRHKDRVERQEKQLNKDLLTDAQKLVSLASLTIVPPDRRLRRLDNLGLLTAIPSTYGHAQSPLWVFQSAPWYGRDPWKRSLSYRIYRMRTKVRFEELELMDEELGHVGKYYQVNTLGGDVWRSASMIEHNASFAFLPKTFDKSQLVEWRFDTTELAPGLEVRRVQLKVANLRVKSSWGRRGPEKSGNEPKKSSSVRTFGPTIYVQSATETSQLKKTLAVYQSELEAKLAGLQHDYETSLSNLRWTLIFINGGTILAALLLGCLLVHLGLRPLRKLSDAVSQVSEKDFRLPLEGRRLPVELQPIAHRLHQSLALLKRAFAREKQAAADISHELRTPLSAMMTTLEVGLRKDRTAEDYRELLEECQECGQQMSQLVERLLALARLDAGADHLRLRDIDVGHLAGQCANLVRPLAAARGLALSVQTNGSATIKADPDKLREVLTNLLHNAIEYNKPDGKVELAVERVNGCLTMQVSDTGVGIAPDAKDHIFERFFRQDESRHSESMHAGIGLALVKGYVDLMGGQITVDSTVGKGSTFRIELPVNQE